MKFMIIYLVVNLMIRTQNNGQMISMEESIDVLSLKNYLVGSSSSDICDICMDKDKYRTVIHTANILMDIEPNFLALDESFSKKLFDVMSTYRYQYDDSVIRQYNNELIYKLNTIKSLTKREKRKRTDYYKWPQDNKRNQGYDSLTSFLWANAHDIIIYYTLANQGRVPRNLSKEVVPSLNFLMNVYPNIFENDVFYANVLQYLDSHCHSIFHRKREDFDVTSHKLRKMKKL